MKCYRFRLSISAARYLDYYRGAVRHVMVRCTTGQTVQFPASLLQKFITPEGVSGNFELSCDDNNKCIGLKRTNSTELSE